VQSRLREPREFSFEESEEQAVLITGMAIEFLQTVEERESNEFFVHNIGHRIVTNDGSDF
jgi:hypothetical protein